MRCNFLENIDWSKVKETSFDLAIFACGYEKRSSYLIELEINYQESFCFAFENENSEEFKNNLKIYKEKFIPIISQSANTNTNIMACLSNFFDKVSARKIRILVDYSSMSRIWYASIIYFFKYLKKEIDIDIYFIYCIPKYEFADSYSDHIIYEPFEYISQITIPEKPTALIISLGDTERQASGLKEYFDAEEVYCFYANSKHKNIILEKNQSLINSLPSSKVIGFPLRDIVYTKYMLETLCRELRELYRIVIAPCGPKTFTLVSFIVASNLSEIDVWRISKPGKTKEKKVPTGECICLKVEYTNETGLLLQDKIYLSYP